MIKIISLSFITMWVIVAVWFKKNDEQDERGNIEVKNIF